MNVMDLDLEKIVIDNKNKNNRFTHEEKIEYLDDAIRNGGYYDDDGIWNSIIIFNNDNHIYRCRVETLIVRKNSIFLKFFPKDHKRVYTIPGGSTGKDVSNIDQAINECREEARINVKNIQSTGITYKEYSTAPDWAIASQYVNWNGNHTEVYVAEYDGKFTGHVDKIDEDKFMMTGKFYDINKVYPYLRKEHKEALNAIYPNRFNSKKIEQKIKDRQIYGIPSLRKFPISNEDQVMESIKYFNTVDKIHEKELAYHLVKAMHRYGIDSSIVGERNRLKTYL